MIPSSLANHRPIPDSLIELVKTALINIFVCPYATVCDLYCAKVADEDKWDDAQIGHYIGIDVATSGVSEVREAWESQRKSYTSQFIELDPCSEDVSLHLQGEENQADIVCCMHQLQLCFETEDKARRLLHNVSSLLKPGGYFFGITPDSTTICVSQLPAVLSFRYVVTKWVCRAKYQKNVEAYHNRSAAGAGMKPNNFPNCIRSETYMITFEVEEEKFPFFGKKYQLQFANDIPAESHCLVHFPSLIRLAREAGLEYVELQNLTEFFEDNRTQFASMLQDSGHVDPRGRLLPRSYDVLGLFTTFIFQKPDPDFEPPLQTPPIYQDLSHEQDEGEWVEDDWRDDEQTSVQTEVSSVGLGKITEQKGILGPGPPELRFAEAL